MRQALRGTCLAPFTTFQIFKEQILKTGSVSNIHIGCRSCLVSELFALKSAPAYNIFGGARRDRTADPLLAKQMLSQLSYGP